MVGGTAELKEAVAPRIRDLSPTLRLAADYVLKNPEVIAMHTLRRVADISELNPPTFTRLAKSLGFNNYEELRELCRREIQQSSRSFADKAASLQRHQRDVADALLPSHAAASVGNIESLVETTDVAELARAADTLAAARNVALIGSLSSAALIDYLGYMARMALPNWYAALRNHETVGMGLRELGPQDAMIAVAHQPYSSRTVSAVQRVQKSGVPVIAVTDSYASPIAADAARVFVTPTDSPHFFASSVPLIVLFEVLLSMVVSRSGEKARERIADVERDNHMSGEYWPG